MKKKMLSLIGMVFIGVALLLVGCSGETADSSQGALTDTQGTAIAESGTLFLKVNPEVAIDYDENGKVTGIYGVNADGTEIIGQYPDYIGKDSSLVLKELIALIGEAGYFVEEIEGEAKKIIIELEAGSALPGNDFLEVMAASAQTAVEEYKLNSKVEVDGETYISLEDAKKIAFEHADVDGTKAKFDDQEFDLDDGVPSYELEFKIDGNEYEYDVHAISGEVIDFEHDKNDNKAAAKPVAPAQTNTDNKNKNKDSSSYDDSAYDKKAAPASKPAAKQAAPKPAVKKAASKPAAKKAAPASKPAPKKSKPAPAAKKSSSKSKKDDTDYSDYDDTDYDDSDYDDTDYDDTDYDDSDYDDSDYD